MTVNPGFGGQPFITETLPKIQRARIWRAERNYKFAIAVDGGINFQTTAECAESGANVFISGSGLFSERNMKGAIKKMRAIAQAQSAKIES